MARGHRCRNIGRPAFPHWTPRAMTAEVALRPSMLKHVHSIVAAIARRFRGRAVLELENLALRHQLHVLRRQRPGRPRLFTIDRLLRGWLFRLWPRCLGTTVV